MQYAVQIVGDDDLPQGMNKVVVERADGGPPVMLINGELARVWRWLRAWEDTLEPCTVPSVFLPAVPLLYAVSPQRAS